jgi:predicted Zn-dependent peptidase
VTDLSGQFVIEAATAPERLDEFFTEVARLLAEHAHHIEPVALERARNQIAVRSLGAQEQPFRRVEDAAQDLFSLGRVRPRAELLEGIEAVTAGQVRAAFERMLQQPAAVAIAGRVRRGAADRVGEILKASLGAG